MERKMFCFQCEQTAGCRGCMGNMGVCRKPAGTAELQDGLTGELISFACAAGGRAPECGARLMLEGLFTTVTNVNFNSATVAELASRVREARKKLGDDAPAYDVRKIWEADEDIRSLKSLILFGLRGMAAYAYHAAVLGYHDAEVDGFFWDEPHYAFPKGIASITGGVADDWTCFCPVCRKRFADYYGYEMPRYMTNDVKLFRWREALVVLSETSKALKEINPALEITCCVHATQNGYYVSEYRGYDNWDMVAACPYFDVFSTTIINWALPEDFYRDITERTVAVARKYGKKLWNATKKNLQRNPRSLNSNRIILRNSKNGRN